MIAAHGLWHQLEIGMYIADQNGVVWRIDHEKNGHLGVQNAAGERHILPPQPPSHPVTVMVPTDEEMLATLADKVGAELLGEYYQQTGATTCPTPPYDNADWWHTHLEIFHAVSAVEDFEAVHEAAEPRIPHQHTP